MNTIRFMRRAHPKSGVNKQSDYFALRKKLEMLFFATGSSFLVSAFGLLVRTLLESISSSVRSSNRKRRQGFCLHTWMRVAFYALLLRHTIHLYLFSIFIFHLFLHLFCQIVHE